jgi:two-component system OmpR family sensor kinase
VLAELAPPGFQPAPAGEEGPYFGIWRYDGTLLRAAALPEGTAAPVQAPPPQRGALLLQSGRLREAVVLGPHSTRILVGLPIGRELTALSAFAWQLAGVGACVLAVGLAGGWLLSGRLLRPIARISATASAISADNLTQRIDARQIDSELAGLARVLNDMFDRLEAAFARQAQFTADASHELRTPLAILRTHAELALSRPRKPEEYRETLETCLRAAGRMTGLVEGLLTLARADAGGLELKREPVDLARVAADMIELFEPLALRKDVALKAELEPVTVTGDSGRLCQVLTNLLSNAVQYNRPGGVVCVRLTRQGHDAVLAVSDTGLGIPDIDKPHLFGRFYRVDKARSRDSGGNGLGLAITRSIVQAHGGAIDFESQVGHGSTFRVRLPCDTPPPR